MENANLQKEKTKYRNRRIVLTDQYYMFNHLDFR